VVPMESSHWNHERVPAKHSEGAEKSGVLGFTALMFLVHVTLCVRSSLSGERRIRKSGPYAGIALCRRRLLSHCASGK
jgi:hypothetical protein